MSEDGVYKSPDLGLLGDEHVRRYEETDGREGHDWNGASCLVLTTTGRRTGEPRKLPLIYGRDDERYLVVASKGGAPNHPFWYLNIVDNPEVEVQVLAERFRAVTSSASGKEKRRLWKIMTETWPNYDVYATRTERAIPLVVLERK